MITVRTDTLKLELSLRKAAKAFGDTTAQSVCRWGVSVTRDLANQTQAWGGSGKKKSWDTASGTRTPGMIPTAKECREAQENAILGDALNVVFPVREIGKRKSRVLTTPDEVNAWIESNRTRRNRRTRELSDAEKKICSFETLKNALKIRNRNAGRAKGAWLGAGMDIARHQTGGDRIAIGKNFLAYAQKHARLGSGKPARSGFAPVALLENRSSNAASSYVLSRKAISESINWGARKTLTWYRRSLKTALDSV